MSPTVNDMARGCGRAMIIRVVATLIITSLGCVFLILPLFLTASLDAPIWILIVAAGLFLLLLFGGGAVYIISVLRQRMQMMDAAFVPLGLVGQAYDTVFRQYHGTASGRQVGVWLYRGPVLDIEINTALQTRLSVTGPHTDTRFLSNMFGRPPLTFDDPALSDLLTFALDADWVHAKFRERQITAILHRLTATDAQFTRQQVQLRPGTLKLMLSGNRQMFGFQVAPEQVQQWFNDLVALARLLERPPAPTQTDASSSAEQFTEKLRQRNPYLSVWIALVTVIGVLACSGVMVVLVLLLMGE